MFYPLFIDLRGRRVLVIGGGDVAERKVDSLLQAEASVTVVAPDLTPRLQKLQESGAIRAIRRKFDEPDLEDALLVISATDDSDTQNRVAAVARARKILVNTVDQPKLCDFIVPAIVRRGDLVAAVSTSGKSPVLAATLRAKMETIITDDAARAARLLGEIRTEIHTRFQDPDRRRKAFERVVECGILEWIAEFDDAAALSKIRSIVEGLE